MISSISNTLISASVALLIGSTTGFLTWAQLRRDNLRKVIDLRTSWALEMYKTRLSTYPQILESILPLSTSGNLQPDADTCSSIADRLNEWLYSTGGLCSDTTTRAAITALREVCREWAQSPEKGPPSDTYRFKNLTIALLRRDLDLDGPEAYEIYGPMPFLTRIQRQLGIRERYANPKRTKKQVALRDIIQGLSRNTSSEYRAVLHDALFNEIIQK